MRRTVFKRGYRRRDGTVVKPHVQAYTYRDFAKMRLKKILAQQKGKKSAATAMKQMGKEWKTAKTMSPSDIKKNYGLFGVSGSAKLNPPKVKGGVELDLD